MIGAMLMLLACLAAWAHVLRMLDGARGKMSEALVGDVRQGGGWMPSSPPLDRRGSARAFTRL
jgi:hypothetical protein